MLVLFFCYLTFEVLAIEVLYQFRERLCDLGTLRFRAIANEVAVVIEAGSRVESF
jgi:hypothetical protein